MNKNNLTITVNSNQHLNYQHLSVTNKLKSIIQKAKIDTNKSINYATVGNLS